VLIVALLAQGVLSGEPTTKQALRSDIRDDWIVAIQAEVHNLLETGDIVQGKFEDKKPEDKLIYFTAWLKIKRNADSNL
jgi:hypothetical protein